ncbi:MAG: CocE/NonD family hydrolase, partial [Rhodobacteraceae bacterium]|nr:CocE/NonD family hydrolase [Paracoccaceae bacterium]
HQYPHTADPAPQIGFLQEALRWWDYWLKGVETGVRSDPAYRVWQQDSTRPARVREYRPGRWLAMADWPTARTGMRRWHLAQGGLKSAPETIEIQVNSPMDCGFGTGLYFPMSGMVPQMSGDQRDDDARSACFDTAPLGEPLDIVGAPQVRLRLKADRPAAQIAIRLCEVHPDGASNRLSYGVLNLCHRNSHEVPEAIEPGEEFVITVRLDQMAARVEPGMRLRLAVSSAYWPFLWPSPERSTLTLLEGQVDLPLCADVAGDEWQFDEAEGAEPWAHRNLRPALYERTRTHDLGTGEITLQTINDEGLNEDAEHGLISGALIRETLAIHPDDPLSATAEVKWTQELRRGHWDIRTETAARMWSDADNFYLSARIEAFEGGEKVYATDFEEQVPRDHG